MSGINAGRKEVEDNEGSTVVYSGTANSTPANVPSSAGAVISGVGVDNTGSESMQVSFDGGTTYKTVNKKTFLSWNVKGRITQIQVKSTNGTTYEAILNFEEN